MEPGLTEEQKKELKRSEIIFVLKCLWNGIQHAVMLFFMNVLVTLGVPSLFDPEDQKTALFIGTLIAFSIFFVRISSVHHEIAEDYKKEVEKILKKS